jgi:hypothetical protein
VADSGGVAAPAALGGGKRAGELRGGERDLAAGSIGAGERRRRGAPWRQGAAVGRACSGELRWSEWTEEGAGELHCGEGKVAVWLVWEEGGREGVLRVELGGSGGHGGAAGVLVQVGSSARLWGKGKEWRGEARRLCLEATGLGDLKRGVRCREW